MMGQLRQGGQLLAIVAFLLACGLIGALIVDTLRGGGGGTKNYSAIFTSVSGLEEGDKVRASGVQVGKVTSIEVADDNTARVSFNTSPSVVLTDGSELTIKYENLIGDQFLSLSRGNGASRPRAENEVIPASRTRPSLDLNELYNGFAPLFEGLSPDRVNRLSASLIQVLQGQGGSLSSLLDDIGSLTGSLADRDRVIGRLIGNLNTVLATLESNDDNVTALVENLQKLISGLSADRKRIGRSLSGIDKLTGSLSDLLRDARPDLGGNVSELKRLSAVINADPVLEKEVIAKLPGHYAVLTRLGAYSSAFQFYICGIRLRLASPTGDAAFTPFISSEVKRCQY